MAVFAPKTLGQMSVAQLEALERQIQEEKRKAGGQVRKGERRMPFNGTAVQVLLGQDFQTDEPSGTVQLRGVGFRFNTVPFYPTMHLDYLSAADVLIEGIAELLPRLPETAWKDQTRTGGLTAEENEQVCHALVHDKRVRQAAIELSAAIREGVEQAREALNNPRPAEGPGMGPAELGAIGRQAQGTRAQGQQGSQDDWQEEGGAGGEGDIPSVVAEHAPRQTARRVVAGGPFDPQGRQLPFGGDQGGGGGGDRGGRR